MRLVASVWLALGVAISVRTLHRPESHTVFPVFTTGSLHWWADQSLYLKYERLDYFRYPPAFAIVMTPFAWMGNGAGGILWSWLSLGVYFLGLHRLMREVLPGDWPPEREAAFLILCAIGGLSGLWNAQSNALLVGLILLGSSAVVRQRWWQAAIFLAVPVILKLTPLPIVLLFCALWPRQLIGRTVVVVCLGALVPFLTRPPEVVLGQYGAWVHHLLESSSERWPGFRDGWTMWVALQHWFQGEPGLPDLRQPIDTPWYRGVQLVSAVGVLVWCLWQKRRGLSSRWLVTATLAMGMSWLMLFGPAVEHPTYVFLTPLLVWGMVQRHAWREGRRLMEAAFLLVMILGWRALTEPLWDFAPWLILALPLGSSLFTLWLLGRRHPAQTNASDQFVVTAVVPWSRLPYVRGSAGRVKRRFSA